MDWIGRLLVGPLLVRIIILFVLPGIIGFILGLFLYPKKESDSGQLRILQGVAASLAVVILVLVGTKAVIPEMPFTGTPIPLADSRAPLADVTRVGYDDLPRPPTQTFTPTPTPTLTPSPTPPSPSPTYPCNAGPARITRPSNGARFASNEDIRIEGAMYRRGYSHYEVQYRQVDCRTGQPIGPSESWVTIGGRQRAPVGGGSRDVLLAEWSSHDRSGVQQGCYQLTIKMIEEHGQADQLEERCRVVIELK